MLTNFNYQDISFFFSYTLFHRWVWIYVCKFHLLISFIISKIHAEMAKRVLFAPNAYITYLAFSVIWAKNNQTIYPYDLICQKLPYLLNGISFMIKDVKNCVGSCHLDLSSINSMLIALYT